MAEHTDKHPLPVGSKLKFGIMLTGLILAVEIVGGLLSNSLALLSDAGHVFADVIALSLSWYGVRQAERPSSSRMTFGYHRVGVIIALVNAVSIFAIAAVIFYEASRRWQQPPEVNGALMLGVAIVGLGVNVFVAFWLRKEQQTNLNTFAALSGMSWVTPWRRSGSLSGRSSSCSPDGSLSTPSSACSSVSLSSWPPGVS